MSMSSQGSHDQDKAIGVVGLGYVGLPLVLAFRDAGFQVRGYEADASRLAQLRAGRSPVDGVSDDRLRDALQSGFVVVDHTEDLSVNDAVFVCVSTPLTPAGEPDLEPVLGAARQVAVHLRRGQLIVLQSTTWPGTTAGPFRAELERSGLRAGSDFALAYAPERTSPGDARTAGPSIPRIVAGWTVADRARCAALLRHIGANVHEVSSLDAAELAKLHENVFRNVNIALANQLALLCERMGLDAWEVISAASSKPFGFMPFWPGPGVGGHCIPVDPYYLSWRARQFGLEDRFVDLAAQVNESMGAHVIELVGAALADRGLELQTARVGIVGVAFKPNVRDTRNAPASHIIASIAMRGARLAYHDPLVPTFRDATGAAYASSDLAALLSETDVIVVLVAHAAIDWELIYERATLVVDAVNSSAGKKVAQRQVVRLGAGWS
jgi:UDP-N-acetyl-D-glucosamine dehydrogenase